MKLREITGATNPLLKVFRRALAEGTTREGWLAIEGPHLLDEALKAGARATVHCALAGQTGYEKFGELIERLPGIAEVARVSDRLFQQVAQTQTPQGIAALVELRRETLETLLERRPALLLVACGLQDPGNLGTIARSAQALGGTGLITIGETVSPFNPKAVRSSAGAIFGLPMLPNSEPRALFERLRTASIQVVAADRRSPSPLAQADLRGPVALLIGREAAGLPAEVAREASLFLSIPIRSGMDSVNAATAASIFLYEAARQRGFSY